MISFSQLEKICDGKNIAFSSDRKLTHLFIDSRKPVTDVGSVFFAIHGEHHDGHAFITDLYNFGVRQFVVEQHVDVASYPDANILQVTSSLDALQKLASFHRRQFPIPVIGVTGSNGKTIVKEWIYQLLSSKFTVVKNPGSYNSQLGVPLSVWQLDDHHDIGIFEAGISKPFEMEKLAEVMRPTVGIFTNIGPAHDEGFQNKEQKIAEKLKLFQHVENLIYCVDHKEIDVAAKSLPCKKLTWGLSDNADVFVRRYDDHYAFRHGERLFNISIPFVDSASLENCMHCVVTLIHFDFTESEIQSGINDLRAVPMRLELKEGISQCQVIDDSYNNDLAGLQISLEFLVNQHQKQRKRLILSDILESGLTREELASRIAELVAQKKISSFVGIGPALKSHASLFSVPSVFFETTSEFLDQFDFHQLQDEVILVKGARKFEFEKIINRLQRKVHGTVMEINLGSIVHNLNVFRSKIKPSTKIMVMVKAFAYGSGSTEVANVLQYHKVNYLGVAYADEGIELRKNNIGLPIMVMNPSEESFSQIIAYNLEPEVYSFKILNALLHFLNGVRCSVHVKLDTGMHRLGFGEDDIGQLIMILKENKNVSVASIFTHLAGADEAEHDSFSKKQAHDFVGFADRIAAAIGYKPIYHVLNSSGILRLPEFQFDMVRLGIGLYGVDPTTIQSTATLRPVATLKTLISQIKYIPQGETIGYGRRGTAEKPMKLATIAIGYADGFSRAFSRGVGEVLVKGNRAKVIGNVCMDMTMIDVTGIDAEEGDEVIVFGEGLPIHELASKIGTISYEILTNTSERVKRVFVAESI